MNLLQTAKDKPQIPLTIAGIVALGSAMPHLAHFVDVWRAPEAAAEASEKAEYVDDKFNAYLAEQREYQAKLDGYTEALTVIQQQNQRQQPALPSPLTGPRWKESDQYGVWCCSEERLNDCWITDSAGRNLWRRCE